MIRIFIEIRDLIYTTNFSLMSVNELVASVWIHWIPIVLLFKNYIIYFAVEYNVILFSIVS